MFLLLIMVISTWREHRITVTEGKTCSPQLEDRKTSRMFFAGHNSPGSCCTALSVERNRCTWEKKKISNADWASAFCTLKKQSEGVELIIHSQHFSTNVYWFHNLISSPRSLGFWDRQSDRQAHDQFDKLNLNALDVMF